MNFFISWVFFINWVLKKKNPYEWRPIAPKDGGPTAWLLTPVYPYTFTHIRPKAYGDQGQSNDKTYGGKAGEGAIKNATTVNARKPGKEGRGTVGEDLPRKKGGNLGEYLYCLWGAWVGFLQQNA